MIAFAHISYDKKKNRRLGSSEITALQALYKFIHKFVLVL